MEIKTIAKKWGSSIENFAKFKKPQNSPIEHFENSFEKTKIRNYSNFSIGIIIPKSIVEENRIRENEEIIVHIERPKAGVLFGFLKGWKRPTQELKNEMKKGWKK